MGGGIQEEETESMLSPERQATGAHMCLPCEGYTFSARSSCEDMRKEILGI